MPKHRTSSRKYHKKTHRKSHKKTHRKSHRKTHHKSHKKTHRKSHRKSHRKNHRKSSHKKSYRKSHRKTHRKSHKKSQRKTRKTWCSCCKKHHYMRKTRKTQKRGGDWTSAMPRSSSKSTIQFTKKNPSDGDIENLIDDLKAPLKSNTKTKEQERKSNSKLQQLTGHSSTTRKLSQQDLQKKLAQDARTRALRFF